MTNWPVYRNEDLGDCQEVAIADCLFVMKGIVIPEAAVIKAYNNWLRKLTEKFVANNGWLVFRWFGIGGIKPTKYIPVTLTRQGFEAALAACKAVSVCNYGHQVMIYKPTDLGVSYVTMGNEYLWSWEQLLRCATSGLFVGRTFTFEV